MKRIATTQISRNIRDAFAGIHKDVERHMGENNTVQHAGELVASHAPALVVGRAQVLLDTILGYLMEDARTALADASTDVKNEFYALEVRDRLKGVNMFKPQTLEISFGPRLIAGEIAAGGTVMAGGLVVGLVLGGVISRVIAGVAMLVAAAAAFRVAQSAGVASARKTIEIAVSRYLADSEAQVVSWLEEVDRAFADEFDKFLLEHGVDVGDPS